MRPHLSGIAIAALFAVAVSPLAPAQAPAAGNFDELAARAQALLDSKPAEAAPLYKQALDLRPSWAEGWMYYGAALYQSAHYAEATDAFRKGIALAPSVGTAWAFLGLSEAELDNSEQAIADMRKGEELGLGENWQFEVAVRVKAAQVLARMSSFDEGMAQLVPLSKHEEKSPAVEAAMGLCSLGIPQTLAEIAPERRVVVALAGKAAWALATQRPEEAAAGYRELMARYPNEFGVHYSYGLYLMETDLDAALAEFHKEAQNNPQHWPALVVMGGLETRRGNTEAAIEALRQAMKVVPTKYRWICHAEMGRADLTAGDVPAAIPEFEAAVRSMPSNAQVHFFLSQAYRRAGRKEDARREAAEFEKLKVQQDPLGVPGLRGFTFSGGK